MAVKPNAPRLTPAAQADIADALRWSRNEFGAAAAIRYAALLRQAIRDIAENATRVGSQRRKELLGEYRVYHLIWSRDNTPGDRVQRPRHFLFYSVRRKNVEVLRVLHDSRDLPLLTRSMGGDE